MNVLTRAEGASAWTATALTATDMSPLPEIEVEIPGAEVDEGVDMLQGGAAAEV